MARPLLSIDLDAIAANWSDLARASGTATAAVVKADAYGLGMDRVAPRLAREGARCFFVATAEEGARLRTILGAGPEIAVFSGHMAGDAPLIREAELIPMINSLDQLTRHFEHAPAARFGVQLDSGMNRLGMEPAEWAGLRDIALAERPFLIMSHLASADEPETGQSPFQLDQFLQMTAGIDAPRSLANTGGIFLGPEYCFDLTRPGIGLYGGLPFIDARPVVSLQIPIIQVRAVDAGEGVGYGAAFRAERPSRIATIGAGYADGLLRSLSHRGQVYAGHQKCPIIGRVSMDLIGVDITDLDGIPESIEVLGIHQSVDSLAKAAGTIGYEILTSLGHRYARRYVGG